MTLLLALLALGAYFLLPHPWRTSARQVVERWQQACAELPLTLNTGVRLGIFLILPMCILVILVQALQETGVALLALLPGGLALLLVFGDASQPPAVARHVAHWREREWPTASANAEQEDWVTPDALFTAELSQARDVLLRESLHELFSPLFWLLLATPVAALGYFLLHRAAQGEDGSLRTLATRWLVLADWIPVRLLAVSFALAGNFTATWKVIAERALRMDSPCQLLLDDAAAAAEPVRLDGDQLPLDGLVSALESLQALIQRALIVWIVMLALHTLWPGA